MFKLIDSEALNAAELAEQCFTLASVLSSVEHAALKESLIFMLIEKQGVLLSLLSISTQGEELNSAEVNYH